MGKAHDRFISIASDITEYRYVKSSLPSIQRIIDDKRGFQTGRLLQLLGLPSTGKTTLALDLLANAQRMGLQAAYADVERTFDPKYAVSCGISLNELMIIKADTAEETLNAIEYVIKERDVQCLVLDSIPALVGENDFDKGYDESAKMAETAGLVTRFCKRIVPIADTHQCLVILLNQQRANISTMSRMERKPYGPYALRHAITWSLEMQRVKNEDVFTIVQITGAKNKLGREKISREIRIQYGQGLDVKDDVLQLSVECGIITQKGAWFYYGDQKAQGAENAKILFPLEKIQHDIENME